MIVSGAAFPTTANAGTASLCVGSGDGCFASLQTAIDAAHNGDTVRVARGIFAGGVTIGKSLRIIGAGRGSTVIRGGGPVVSIGDPSNSVQPVVSLQGLDVVGGVSHGDGVFAYGGGISIPHGPDGSLGATVVLHDVVVAGNRAVTTRTIDSPGGAVCPGGPCPAAFSAGGGIANFGTLTLVNALVRDNRATGVSSDADGGGIYSDGGSLTLDRTVVVGNHATPSLIHGRFAEGGGLFVNSGSLAVRHSSVSFNEANLTTTLPVAVKGRLIDMVANSAGIHVGDDTPTVIDHTTISGNVLRATDLAGEPIAIDAGMLIGASELTMTYSSVSNNIGIARVKTTADVGAGGTALEVDGRAMIQHTRIVNNSVVVYSPAGSAGASSGLAVFDFDGKPDPVLVEDSVIAHNTAIAVSDTGSAEIQGAGILNNSVLELRHVVVEENSGRAIGRTTIAHGGGIWNGEYLSGPFVQLVISNSSIVKNHLVATDASAIRGAGLYTTKPVRLSRTKIAHNTPDQCFGCELGARTSMPARQETGSARLRVHHQRY